jgi:hypothetical protein
LRVLQTEGQAVISTSKSYYLTNTFRKAIGAIDSSDGSGQSKLKTFWIRFTILDAVKNNHDSWEEVKTSTLTGVWKKLIPTLMDDFWGVQHGGGGSNCRCGGNIKRTRIRLEA